VLQQGAQTLSIPTDARDPESVKQAFETIRKELGAPDVLVYNAGAFKYGSLLDIDPAEFESLWKVHGLCCEWWDARSSKICG
jgi:NAD(P)-dependent dehydrogenase (short-subunit alcohol dehydrogenase family)